MEILIWIIVGIILVIYIILIPYLKHRKMKQDQIKMEEFQKKLKIGDQIVMFSGIHGKIKKLQNETALIEVASKVTIEVERTTIVGVKHDG